MMSACGLGSWRNVEQEAGEPGCDVSSEVDTSTEVVVVLDELYPFVEVDACEDLVASDASDSMLSVEEREEVEEVRACVGRCGVGGSGRGERCF